MNFPASLQQKLVQREQDDALRMLPRNAQADIDFYSNDYLGFATDARIAKKAAELLHRYKVNQHGATGSRLISGNTPLTETVEQQIAQFHQAETALLFNSGYDANIGLLGCVPQRNDLILFDELAHASIRDGIRLSLAKSVKFKHNDLSDLQDKISKYQAKATQLYVVTESVFSMDGDQPDLQSLSAICQANACSLILDEAHAIGVCGEPNRDNLSDFGLHDQVFARIVTFGKAMGAHGAAILGSKQLQTYLLNFARSFIYTTALPPHSIAVIAAAYELLSQEENQRKLHQNIQFFKSCLKENQLNKYFISSETAIQSCVIEGNAKVKKIASVFQENGIQVKAILSPTVPKAKERLRFCLHSFNTSAEIEKAISLLKRLL